MLWLMHPDDMLVGQGSVISATVLAALTTWRAVHAFAVCCHQLAEDRHAVEQISQAGLALSNKHAATALPHARPTFCLACNSRHETVWDFLFNTMLPCTL